MLTEVLAALAWNLPPGQRGLAREEGKKTYHFPADYPERITNLIVERNKAKDK
ncbi:MAG: hypothetical protein ACYSUT_03510 [Planctomycetota bacterium]